MRESEPGCSADGWVGFDSEVGRSTLEADILEPTETVGLWKPMVATGDWLGQGF